TPAAFVTALWVSPDASHFYTSCRQNSGDCRSPNTLMIACFIAAIYPVPAAISSGGGLNGYGATLDRTALVAPRVWHCPTQLVENGSSWIHQATPSSRPPSRMGGSDVKRSKLWLR